MQCTECGKNHLVIQISPELKFDRNNIEVLAVGRNSIEVLEIGRNSIEVGRNTIEVGKIADLCLFDLDSAFEVSEAFFASKSKNSPFIGDTLYGRTRCTFMQGDLVYQDIGAI
mgnify:CR=1 FL=1